MKEDLKLMLEKIEVASAVFERTNDDKVFLDEDNDAYIKTLVNKRHSSKA